MSNIFLLFLLIAVCAKLLSQGLTANMFYLFDVSLHAAFRLIQGRIFGQTRVSTKKDKDEFGYTLSCRRDLLFFPVRQEFLFLPSYTNHLKVQCFFRLNDFVVSTHTFLFLSDFLACLQAVYIAQLIIFTYILLVKNNTCPGANVHFTQYFVLVLVLPLFLESYSISKLDIFGYDIFNKQTGFI